MDNIAHSLAGMAVAKFGRRKLPQSAHRSLMWAGIVASNLPDLDILTSLTFEGGKLNYLMHHRGHTHTLIIALPLGLLIGWIACRLGRLTAKEKLPVLPYVAVSTVAIALHLLMDYWNIYGVHLFWPFHSGWQYGDSVFIVEPLLWLALAAHAYRHWPSAISRVVMSVIIVAALSLTFVFQPFTVGLFAVAWVTIVAGLEVKVPRLNAGVLHAVSLVVALFLVSGHVKDKIRGKVRGVAPFDLIEETAVTPSPANPFCWRFYTKTYSQNRYRTFIGRRKS